MRREEEEERKREKKERERERQIRQERKPSAQSRESIVSEYIYVVVNEFERPFNYFIAGRFFFLP